MSAPVAGHERAVWRAVGGMGTSHLVRGPWTLCGRPGAPSDPADDRAPVCQICASIGRDHYGIGELAGLGLTVRQIHHWCDRGWLRFTWTISGRRVFAPEEFAVARRAVALIKGGYRTERACELARSSQD